MSTELVTTESPVETPAFSAFTIVARTTKAGKPLGNRTYFGSLTAAELKAQFKAADPKIKNSVLKEKVNAALSSNAGARRAMVDIAVGGFIEMGLVPVFAEPNAKGNAAMIKFEAPLKVSDKAAAKVVANATKEMESLKASNAKLQEEQDKHARILAKAAAKVGMTIPEYLAFCEEE